MNQRIQDVKNNQQELKANATKSMSMNEMRAENAKLRNDVLKSQGDLSNTMKELDLKSRQCLTAEE